MDVKKKTKQSIMLDLMSSYAAKQPGAIEKLCKELCVPSGYISAIDLFVESFLTVRAFAVLMREGLLSSACTILRVLIEQTATLNIIAFDSAALSRYVSFQSQKNRFSASDPTVRKEIEKDLKKEIGLKSINEIKQYLDYGWIKGPNDTDNRMGKTIILEKAGLSETEDDIKDYLNAFSHGQKSFYYLLRKKDFGNKYVSRMILMAGKLFLNLCKDKHYFFNNDEKIQDDGFDLYIKTCVYYYDLNARAFRENLNTIIEKSKNLKEEISLYIGELDFVRGLIYCGDLDVDSVNRIARAFVIDAINVLIMITKKLFSLDSKKCFGNPECLIGLINAVGIEKINDIYEKGQPEIALNDLLNLIKMDVDEWTFLNESYQCKESDEQFIMDLSSFAHVLFEEDNK